MNIRKSVGMPDHLFAINPLLPDTGDGTGGGTTGGTGVPSVTASPAPIQPPVAPPTLPVTGPPAVGPNGFAEGVSLAELPAEQVTAYWKYHARRHEDASKAAQAELARTKPLADQFAALEAASRTEQERAIEAARTEAATAARAQADTELRDRYAPALVQARLESALAGRMTSEQVAALLPNLNVPALLDANGLPDADRIAAFVATIPVAPVAPATQSRVDLGGGRTTPVVSGGIAAGVALYEERKSKPKA